MVGRFARAMTRTDDLNTASGMLIGLRRRMQWEELILNFNQTKPCSKDTTDLFILSLTKAFLTSNRFEFSASQKVF